ncbi:preprotein translocase subunit SecA [Clostridium collagenovorans DSM 3089]|uniref:Protein translocase subunit SecA n=1 Tax=Clostridium collagenovorans DSM 3089 TaxID=1121306 RepID=A0A1M5W1F1_9CLOT|nr:preprotein translocase subunit SecA [Clostridium collagenovorans]SHH81346.1 preprotein translocase subunit SecA [Clostridium collagenovorans DSM 3089]
MSFLNKIFKSYSERQIKKIDSIADKVMSYDSAMTALSDEELRGKTEEFRNRLNNGETLDDILPEAFAVVREASWRVLGLKHYRVQVLGGIILHQGRIAEMRTGEGKTLVATLPSYLNGLTGNGVHVITVNDYLAKRDRDEMGKVHEFLGLSVGVILHDLTPGQRKEAYGSDITYGTNNEFGFDYLRDNMVVYKEERVQRELNFCIVDEVDSILIDEARTPLIISGEGEKSTEFYKVANYFVKSLTDEDYEIDEKTNSVILTDSGVEKAEAYFHLENYADAENMHIQHHVVQALKAHYRMRRDKDYMVKDGEIIIVDEFTGRLMEGRRYSDGLHQAIEAKEGVKVEKESKTLATITFQNYFRMYKKLSGMTGTALTEESEFREIYGLDVIEIPTNKTVRRVDQPDLVYKTIKAKYEAIVDEIAETHSKNQPVLVGTVSIEKSEVLSEMLKRKRVPHQVLNAKYHEKEAEIVSHAGEPGMVTIATNMAGRGTDIKLGDDVVGFGGLKVIGTERHESRRIDNQLRGRSGRQGDPGESRFYVSLEDDLMRIFGSEKLQSVVDKLGLEDDEAIESKMVSNAIEGAQKKVEGNNFDVRKNVLQYDDVMNQQRTVIYKQRSEVLENEDLREQIFSMIEEVVEYAVNSHVLESDDSEPSEEIAKLIHYLEDILLPKDYIKVEDLVNKDKSEITSKLIEVAKNMYEEKEVDFGEDLNHLREIERVILLKVVDTKWMDHIDSMDHLRQGMGLRAYKQQDPVQAYQFEGSEMFNEMIWNIKVETIKYLFHIQPQNQIERERVAVVTSASHGDDSDAKREPVKKEKKTGRNELCSCGSGKKYKNCCGRFE